ncbi:ribosomal-protein-alanine N-acetyltransferase [Parasulfuritortus cantonensis]|uniref:[Ribosomal protein bS18]-alanine N-acetyltransferase n=1 Tax=Parasulfuritortus cantonensis TaxID=2528202 RepID=A0A4R1BMD6_9PROT|nr:ribosomal protein S18-alanine N-acetyltransferase [Parasulfuritortus cantonensis]TCJ18497.1 ribosomal-protein-alanine N-acetyltransferase [Parasulfuritortus cantonensis]
MSAQVQFSPPNFRPMTREDVDAIILIERAAYPYPWTRGNFRDCLDSGYSCWVAEQDGRVVGYSIMMAGAGEGHVLNCCVAPDWQGRGLGRLLMRRMIAGAPEYQVECLFLEVRPSNARAIALYESLGFETVGLRRHYYPADQGREDALVMRRYL